MEIHINRNIYYIEKPLENETTQSLDKIRVGKVNSEPKVKTEQNLQTQDGGYGSVVVACTFLSFSLVSFHFLTFAIFAPEFAVTFSLSESDLGLIASLRMGIASFTGVLTGPLVQWFGCRPLAITSALVCTAGYVTAALATDRLTITLTYGLIAGVGAGLVGIPSIVIVQQYFVKHRAIAAGISSVGLSFFAMISSPLARLLVDTYGWRGASLIFGGFSLQTLVTTALYRPLKPNMSSSPLSSRQNGEVLTNSCMKKLKASCVGIFQKQLWTPSLLLYLACSTTSIAVADAYYMRLALIGRSVGLDPVKAAFLPSVIAVSSMLFRGLSGFLARCVPPHVIFGVFNVLPAAVVFVVPLLPSTFAAHTICAALYGIGIGVVYGIRNTTLYTLVGLELLPLALSSLALFTGIFQIADNLIIGWLLDATGSYTITLWYAATIHSLGCVCAFVIIFLKWREIKMEGRRQSNVKNNESELTVTYF